MLSEGGGEAARVLVSRRADDINRYSPHVLSTCYEFGEGRGEKFKGEERKGWYVGWSVGGHALPSTHIDALTLHSILRNLYDVELRSIYDRPGEPGLYLLTKYPITSAILTLKRENCPEKVRRNKTCNNWTICSRCLLSSFLPALCSPQDCIWVRPRVLEAGKIALLIRWQVYYFLQNEIFQCTRRWWRRRF